MNCKRRIMLMLCVVFAGVILAVSAFAEEVIVQGILKSTGGFKFPDGTILSSAGNISGNSSSGAFQVTQSGTGHAIDATSQAGDAVHASGTNTGIYGESLLANGILGFTYAANSSMAGVVGSSQGVASGVRGVSSSGDGVRGESNSSTGIYGQSTQANGIIGYTDATSNSFSGVVGSSHGVANGIWGNNTSSGIGVRGSSSTGDAVHGESAGTAVYGQSSGSVGVLGYTSATGAEKAGVKGFSQSDAQGVIGEGRSTGAGVYAVNSSTGYALWAKSSGTGAAGHFDGRVEVTGALDGASASFNGNTPNGLYASTSASGGNGISASANNGTSAYGVLGSSTSGYGVVGYASGSAVAAGRFMSSAGIGTALVAESPTGAQVMKVDATGVHAGPGMTGTPLAYGVVNSDGTCTNKSANVTCTKGSTGYYYIAIAGEQYEPDRHITIVTLAYNISLLVPLVDAYGVTPQKLAVALKTPAGTLMDNRFYFVTFKP